MTSLRDRTGPGLGLCERNSLADQRLIAFIARSLHIVCTFVADSLHVRCRFFAGVSPCLQAMNLAAGPPGHYHIAATRGGGFVPRQARPYSDAAARVPTRWNRMASRSQGVVLTRKEPLFESISISRV